MKRIINIDGKDIPFKASALTPIIYRRNTGKEFFKDLKDLFAEFKAAEDPEGLDVSNLSVEALLIFRDIAYTMAKQADPEITDDKDAWMDGFEMFSIYYILPQIVELWGLNEKTTSKAKKN